ncbi:MAG: hypothetical protein HY902_11125 [Deltaproteobacteria bacterium]|nr:hypothetical protein [Deltaproteobacteria bacterium]
MIRLGCRAGRSLLLAVWTAAALLGSPPLAAARGDDPAVVRKAEAVATEAKLLFQQKAYEAAAERFMEAYTLVQRASLIFNAARAYQEAGVVHKAIALFKAYMELPDATDDGKADAARRIATLEAALRAREAKPVLPPPKVEPPPTPKPEAAPLPAPATPAAAAPPVAAKGGLAGKSKPGANQDKVIGPPPPRPFPWASAAATGGLMVGTGVMYGLALSEALAAHDMESSLRTTEQSQQYQDHVNRAQIFRGAAVAAGSLAVVAAAWLGWELWGPAAPPPKKGEDNQQGSKKTSSLWMAVPTVDGAAVSWTLAW